MIAYERFSCQSTIEKQIDAVLSVTKIFTYDSGILGGLYGEAIGYNAAG